MIQRTVLFLKFALVFGRLFNRTFMDIDLIVPLWNGKSNKTSVDGQTFKSLWIQTLFKSQISTIVDSSQKARSAPA